MSGLIYDRYVNFVGLNGAQKKGLCPFHKDSDPSFHVNTDTGQWYCFGCPDNEGGGPVKFVQKLFDVSESIAQYAVDFFNENNGKLPFPNEEEVDGYRQELLSQPAVIDWLQAIGVTDAVSERYRIGWENNRLIIPIPSKTGMLVNLRKYMPPGSKRSANTPKTVHIKNLGENRYFPYDAFDEDEVYITEGEKDVLVARSQGLNAVTTTGGKNIPMNELHLFKGKKVFLMLDIDNVGKKLVKQYLTLLKNIAKEVCFIKLPEKDFAEFFEKFRTADIQKYISEPEEATVESKGNVKLKDSISVSMVDSVMVLQNMKITGKHAHAYTVPKCMTVNCSGSTCKKECPFREEDFTLDVDERSILSFIKCPDTAQSKFLQQHLGCKNATIAQKEYINAQIIFFQEDITSLSEQDYYNQMQTGIYLFDKESLQTNKSYDFTAIRTTDPKTQQIVYIITDAVEKSLDIEIDEDMLLSFAQRAEGKSVDTLLKEYYDEWLPNLEVYGRDDLFGTVLLTYISAIGFYWGNTLVKGWLDTLVLGDTRTGKSKLAKNFMKTVSLGAYVSGENSRKTGIIGGIQKLGDNWALSWGIVPLNDKRLVVIDEASGLTVEDIQELSQMRSEGILSITKIIAETTTARTRLLWISNPRSGKALTDYYWKGVDALKEFLPVQEDLARFDLVITAGLEDVQNTHQIHNAPMMTEKRLNQWRQLILFAWHLKPEQISLTNDIRNYIVQISERLGDFYKGLPLFLKTNGYEKITRLAIAIAILTFSYENGNLIVTKEHVDSASQFIQKCYAKQSFGYELFSQKENDVHAVTDEKELKVKELLGLYVNMGILFESGTIRNYMIQEVLGIDKDDGNKLIAELLRLGFLKITPFGYRASPQFLDMIRKTSHTTKKGGI